MSTATLDIINEIKALGPKERAEVARFARQFDEEEKAARTGVKYADKAKFEEALEFVLKRHAPLLRKLAE